MEISTDRVNKQVNILFGKPERNALTRHKACVRMILKCILKKPGVRFLTAFEGLGIRFSECDN